MKRMVFSLIVVSVMASCSNTPELETGEIKTLASLEQAFKQLNKPKRFIDAQKLLTRSRSIRQQYLYYSLNCHRAKTAP